jgi:hypothetical protein
MRAPAIVVLLACASCGAPLGAQQPIESPDFVFVKKGPLTAILRTDMPYQIGDTPDSIVVPTGFVTDFASIPRALWSRISPVDDYKLAAVIHDYLYWYQPCERGEADNLLAIAMAEEGVALSDRAAVYAEVRAGGAQAWKSNSTARDVGEIRLVPRDAGRPGPLETWDQFSRRLKVNGVKGTPGRMPRQKYCDYGRSRVVPSRK